jgi:hypothetical protein
MLKFTNLLILSSTLMISHVNLIAIEKEQLIHLKKGWNAIYLEVDPLISEQNLSAFILKTVEENSTIPIEVISTYLPNESSVEYIGSPDEEVWKKPSWNSWIRDDFPEAFLTNLYDLEDGQAYLVRSSQDFVWKIKGEVRKITTNWQSNSFNLVGFEVGITPISFHQLFQNSSTAITLQKGPVYTLEEGIWRKVSLPDEAVEKGKSYWVFANGSSNFQGSVELGLDNGAKLMNFLDVVNTKTIALTNNSSATKTVTLSLENNEVPLSLVEQNALAETTYTPVTSHLKTLELSANSETLVKVAVRRSEIKTSGKKEGILKMEVKDTHEVQYLPISAYGEKQ